MSNIENPTASSIGENIKALRKNLGITQTELADRISALSGEPHSASTISAWERGTRSIFATDAYFLAQALETSLESLYVYTRARLDDVDVKAFVGAVRALPINDKHIMEYMLVKWSGNRHALLQICAMIMNVDKRTQADMVGMSAMLYKQKAIVSANIDVDAVEKEWERLLK